MLDLYRNFIGIIEDYLIRGIFISVLIVWIATFFKGIHSENAKSIFKWVIIGYASLVIANYIMFFAEYWFGGVEFSGFGFEGGASIEYWLFFWVMVLANTLFPFILLFRKVGNKIIFLLFVAVLMNFGWLFEWFVVVVTSFHRDYLTEGGDLKFSQLFPYSNWIYLLRGLIVGIVVLIVGNLLSRNRH